jgi:hypothetical protein
MRLTLLILALVFSGLGCTEVNIPPTAPSGVQTGRGGGVITSKDVIELRVFGNASSVRVRYSNSEDGLTQTITTLPFFITFDSTKPSLFITLEATPISYSTLTNFPFLSVQIFVNGSLFREATANDFFLNTLSVAGTYRSSVN